MLKKDEKMYHHDFIGVSHAHVGKIPEDHPYKETMADGVTGRFMKKRGLK